MTLLIPNADPRISVIDLYWDEGGGKEPGFANNLPIIAWEEDRDTVGGQKPTPLVPRTPSWEDDYELGSNGTRLIKLPDSKYLVRGEGPYSAYEAATFVVMGIRPVPKNINALRDCFNKLLGGDEF